MPTAAIKSPRRRARGAGLSELVDDGAVAEPRAERALDAPRTGGGSEMLNGPVRGGGGIAAA